MFPRKMRLSGKREVTRVYQKGERQGGQYLLVRVLPNRGREPRLAVVVSTAVSKKATERNRAKRLLRALLTNLALPQADIVISVRRLPANDWSGYFGKELSQWFPKR